MAVSYKHFDPARTVFWALFLCFFFVAQNAQAQNALFKVDAVAVDVTADSAMNARNQAFEQAQEKAFHTLAERMLSETELQSFTMPEARVISTLVQDYEVTEEKLSNVRYVGTYTFRFKDKAVRRYFSGSGAQYTDVASRPILILPYYRHEGQMVLWSPYNEWMQAWNNEDDLGGLVPVRVPLGDLQDVRDIGDDAQLNYDQDRLRAMQDRYGAGDAVLAVALPDEKMEAAEEGGLLTIQIYRTDMARPEYVQQVVVKADAGQSQSDLMRDAVRKVHRALQKNWKKKTLVSAAQSNSLYVQVPFEDLQQWIAARQALKYVHGINDIVVKSLSPKMAQVEILFQGDEQRLRLALRQADITLSAPRFSIQGLSAGPGMTRTPLVYELYLNRYAPRGQHFTIGGTSS